MSKARRSASARGDRSGDGMVAAATISAAAIANRNAPFKRGDSRRRSQKAISAWTVDVRSAAMTSP